MYKLVTLEHYFGQLIVPAQEIIAIELGKQWVGEDQIGTVAITLLGGFNRSYRCSLKNYTEFYNEVSSILAFNNYVIPGGVDVPL